MLRHLLEDRFKVAVHREIREIPVYELVPAKNGSKLKATLDDLRHTAATWMLAAGVDVASVSRVLGHATPTTTLSIYAHALPAAESRAVASIDDRLARAKGA